MIVRLSYSSEMDEIPDKVAEMIKQSVEPIENNLKLVKACCSLLEADGSNSAEHVGQILDSARQNLLRIDQVLSESQTIITGYAEAKKQNLVEGEPVPSETPEMANPDILPPSTPEANDVLPG